jgi:hypothetical protein
MEFGGSTLTCTHQIGGGEWKQKNRPIASESRAGLPRQELSISVLQCTPEGSLQACSILYLFLTIYK